MTKIEKFNEELRAALLDGGSVAWQSLLEAMEDIETRLRNLERKEKSNADLRRD